MWANLGPPTYRVTVPAGREPLYEWAAPVFLSLAVAAAGLWLVRVRTVRAGRARVLLWVTAGGLTIGYSAWWVWRHRGNAILEPSWMDWAAVSMPWLWVAVVVAVIWRDSWRGRREARKMSPVGVGEIDPAPTDRVIRG